MLTCPQCGTTTLTNPRLQLLYSSCCGLCLCTDCIHSLFQSAPSSSSTSTLPCPSCRSPLTSKAFDPAPLSTQRFTSEVKTRQRLLRLLPFDRADFPSQAEWDDWQEWLSDVVYDLTEGDRDEQKEAERRVEDWRRDNQTKIDRAMERRREEVNRAMRTGEGEVEGLDAGMAVMPLVPSFTLPTPQLQPSLLHSLDAAIAAMDEGEERRAKKEERHAVWSRGRRSGGWKDEFAERREREEMMEGWLVT